MFIGWDCSMAVSPMPLNGGRTWATRPCYALVATRTKIFPHRLGEAELQRIADQCVSDRHLGDARHRAEERRQVCQAEVVSGVHFQSHLGGTLGGGGIFVGGVRIPLGE